MKPTISAVLAAMLFTISFGAASAPAQTTRLKGPDGQTTTVRTQGENTTVTIGTVRETNKDGHKVNVQRVKEWQDRSK